MKVKLGFLLSAHCLIMLYNVQSFTKISDDLKNQNSAESGVAPAPPLHSHPHKKVMIISGRRNKCGNFIESTWIFSFFA